MTMASLPKECRAVLAAPAPESEMAATFGSGKKDGSGKGGDTGTSIAAVIESPEKSSLAEKSCRGRAWR